MENLKLELIDRNPEIDGNPKIEGNPKLTFKVKENQNFPSLYQLSPLSQKSQKRNKKSERQNIGANNGSCNKHPQIKGLFVSVHFVSVHFIGEGSS